MLVPLTPCDRVFAVCLSEFLSLADRGVRFGVPDAFARPRLPDRAGTRRTSESRVRQRDFSIPLIRSGQRNVSDCSHIDALLFVSEILRRLQDFDAKNFVSPPVHIDVRLGCAFLRASPAERCVACAKKLLGCSAPTSPIGFACHGWQCSSPMPLLMFLKMRCVHALFLQTCWRIERRLLTP